MKVLWLSINSGLYSNKGNSYNGGEWIASLQSLIQQSHDIDLALAFVTSDKKDIPLQIDKTKYYPIYNKPQNALSKLFFYYGGYKHIDENIYVEQLKAVIDDFKPDIIQLFGLENCMATILGKTNVPIVVHLQGLLAPCNNAFFPIGLNKNTFRWPPTIREWILRNGYLYAKKSIQIRGEREKTLFKRMKYAMGRTKWDYEVTQLLSPQSSYYHVDEVMRSYFYEKAGTYNIPKRKKFIITSTISETIYKGLDLILKTIFLLEHETTLDFEWRIIGVNSSSSFVKLFEKENPINRSKIKYLGVLNTEELAANLLDSNVYVHPSYIDNSPNSVCEAQLLGIPIIATNVGGISSLIEHGKTGFLIPANAPYELAYHLKNISMHPKESYTIGFNGYLTAQNRHNKNFILKQILNAYKDIITSHSL